MTTAKWERLTEVDIETIHNLAAAGTKQKEIAGKYGVAPGHVSRILSGKIWRRVKERLDKMAESKRPEGSIWAIVGAADGRKYLGYCAEGPGGVDVSQALEVVVRVVPARTPEGQVVQMPQRTLAPTEGCLVPPVVRVRGSYTLISVDAMDEGDRKEYQEMLSVAEEGMVEARARRAGITTSTPGGTHGGSPLIRP